MKPPKRNHIFIPSRFEDRIEGFFHNRYIKRKRNHLLNKDFSIISNSCVGASIYKDENLKFLTPFIAVYIDPDDFVLMLQNLKWWLEKEITKIDYECDFPVGLLGGKIKLFFVHEDDFEDAVKKWKYRTERINWNNIFIILDPIKQTFRPLDEKEICSEEVIQKYSLLEYKNKICFVSKKQLVLNDSCIFLKCYSKYDYPPYIGRITLLSGKRVYDKYFDVETWLNEGYQNE